MKFGFFFQLPCAPWQSDQERYSDTLAQLKHGEHLGFDTAGKPDGSKSAR
jgi:hypothetical protein